MLVGDDDPDIREFNSLILDMEGFAVCGLDNVREVLDRIQSCRPDLILRM
ncbi:response regulator [Mucilaginibacter pineti]|nr:response regulator [Mucilaginibacter pineti]